MCTLFFRRAEKYVGQKMVPCINKLPMIPNEDSPYRFHTLTFKMRKWFPNIIESLYLHITSNLIELQLFIRHILYFVIVKKVLKAFLNEQCTNGNKCMFCSLIPLKNVQIFKGNVKCKTVLQ
jgi:hypothetical protein